MFRRLVIYFLLFVTCEADAQSLSDKFLLSHGGIVRGDSTKKEISLVFTGDEYGEGLSKINYTLKQEKIKAAFFFTGRFYRNNNFKNNILRLTKGGHYLGPHSNEHLLYCDWTKRDSLLVTKDSFEKDLSANFLAMKALGLPVYSPQYFIAPFEWWNDSIAAWSKNSGLQIINFSPGIRTNADYTWPDLANYKSIEWILTWLKEIIKNNPNQLNGSIILIHVGTDPRRKDKLYDRLSEMIILLKKKGYQFKRIDNLLQTTPVN